MRDLFFVEPSTTTILPRHRRSTLAIAAAIHVVLFVLLIVVKTQPTRVTSPGSSYVTVAAYVAPARGMRKAAAPKKIAPPTPIATEVPAVQAQEAPPEYRGAAVSEAASDAPSAAAGPAGVAGDQSTAGPVRLGIGTLTLVKKVSPTYPSVMQSARLPGVVVLDAVIHSDGTIGDITVLRSTNELFARAAIEAVKKWRYTPLPYEGIVTVTVNFNLT